MNRYIIVSWLLLLAMMVLTVGCRDDEGNDPRQKAIVELVPSVSSYTDIEPITRATSPTWAPNGYYLYDDLTGVNGVLMSNTGAQIKVFFTRDVQGGSPVVYDHGFSYNGKWVIDEEVENPGEYQLYGFVPYSASTVYSIVEYDNFANGATLTLNNLNSVMNQDMCVIVGAKHGRKEGNSDPVPVTENSKVAAGDFTCHISGGDTPNYIFLLFDHLYAALRFRFRVHEEYAALRKIKLKRLELLAYSDEACTTLMTKHVSTTITLRANNTGASPIVGDVNFTPVPESGDMSPVLIYDSEVELPSGKYPEDYEVVDLRGEDIYTDNMGFVPKTSSYYKLISTYDVYDTNDNLIRQDCTAENKIDPRKQFNQTSLNRGYIYTLRFTVRPTYLYVLSEPDLDNPTMTIN